VVKSCLPQRHQSGPERYHNNRTLFRKLVGMLMPVASPVSRTLAAAIYSRCMCATPTYCSTSTIPNRSPQKHCDRPSGSCVGVHAASAAPRPALPTRCCTSTRPIWSAEAGFAPAPTSDQIGRAPAAESSTLKVPTRPA
jgi:hypothetical protein